MNDISAVYHVISETDWFTETRLLLMLLCLYAFLITSTIITWHKLNFQAAFFCLLCIGIYAAQYINRWCATNWKLISVQHQYFDSSGMFISIVYSMPLLFNLLVLVIKWLKSASADLIYLKRQEVIRKSNQKSKKTD